MNVLLTQTEIRFSKCVCCLQGHSYMMSNAAARRIVAVSSDVLFSAVEGVFVTGICRAVAAVACTYVAASQPAGSAVAGCELGAVMSVDRVTTAQQMTRLWAALLNTSAADAERRQCHSAVMLHVGVASLLLVTIVCCLFACQHTRCAKQTDATNSWP